MSVKKTFLAVISVLLVIIGTTFGAGAQESFDDFLHYASIGRFEMAQSYADELIDSNPDPVEMLAIIEANPRGYALLVKLYNDSEELKDSAGKIIDIIEQGRFIRRTDPEIIRAEVKRLSTTVRGRLSAEQRLKNAGEYAIPFMLDALADQSRKEEFSYVADAMGKMGKDAVAPLAASLQMSDVALKAEVIRALGSIAYPHSLAYLKFVYENDGSAQIKAAAQKSICQIDPAAMKISSAQLFMELANRYYNHLGSVAAPADFDFANLWFWDVELGRLQREKVSKEYYFELMAMRSCEWALRADASCGEAISIWVAAFFKAEKTGVAMPEYFGENHADALTYAITAGPEYLHRALARALKDKDDYVALNLIEALAVNAGEASLLYSYGVNQPLVDALSNSNVEVKYSAAIAIAAANPSCEFVGSKLIIENLSDAISMKDKQQLDEEAAAEYAVRATKVVENLAMSNNKLIDVSKAQTALIKVIQSQDEQMRVAAGNILSTINSPDSQRVLFDLAYDELQDIDFRLIIFKNLTDSVKRFGNMLSSEQVDTVYEFAGSTSADVEIRSASAGVYGALNLPSQKVKNLILDQAKK